MLSPSVLDLDDLYLVWCVQNVNPNETVLFYEVSYDRSYCFSISPLLKMSSTQHDTRAELAELLKRRNELSVRFWFWIVCDSEGQSAIIVWWALFGVISAGEFGQLGAADLRLWRELPRGYVGLWQCDTRMGWIPITKQVNKFFLQFLVLAHPCVL